MASLCPRCGAEFPMEFAPGQARVQPHCRDCHLVVEVPPPMLEAGDEDDELAYELDEWGVAERGALTAALAEREILYRWEPGLTLVVPVDVEELVDALLDDIDEAEWEPDDDEDGGEDDDEDDEDGGEDAQTAMSELFVAADRLSHHPDDVAAAADLLTAGEVVDDTNPPYGIEVQVWERVRELTAEVARHLDRATDEDAVANAARNLRDFLRGYV